MGTAAWGIPGFSFSLPANADYSVEATYLFTGVRALAASGTGVPGDVALAPVSATGDPIIGVLQNNPQLAEAGTVVNDGITKMLFKDTVAIGDKLMACPAGGFIKATTGKYAVAIALQAGAAGQYGAALLANLGLQ